MNTKTIAVGIGLLSAVAVAWPGAAGAAPAFGDPLPGLSRALTERFAAGEAAFGESEGVSDGLGPVFNATSCGACHDGPALGGSSAIVETRIGKLIGGRYDPLAALGGSLVQSRGIGYLNDQCDFTAETVPPEATISAQRITTPLFGLGLVDAVPEEVFLLLAAFEGWLWPATAGRPNIVPDLVTGGLGVGRFGWKAQVPSLLQFSGDAYLNEIGITSPMFPHDNCPQGDCALLVACNPVAGIQDDGTGVAEFADFMTLLAPPPRLPLSREATAGQGVFYQIGCHHCHTPALETGASAVPALDHVLFTPFSDFLLHDMGSLGDDIVQEQAGGDEMRTAPLWGLRARARLLHDGRALSVTDAILAHDGQGHAARQRFIRLPRARKSALLAFLESL